MPETFTELTQADHARRQRAIAYEQARGDRDTAKRALPKIEAEVERLTTSIKHLDDLDERAAKMDGTIPGLGGYIARDVILRNIALALTDQRRRLEQATAKRKELRDKLTRLNAAVAAFD